MSLRKAAIVIGRGLSGCVASRLLLDRGYQVIAVDQTFEIGGLAKTWYLEDAAFEFGPHILHSHKRRLLSFIERYVSLQATKAFAKISLCDSLEVLHDYPLTEKNLELLPKPQARSVLEELTHQRSTAQIYPDFESHLRNTLGNTLFEVYFKEYSEKLWGVKLSSLRCEWTRSRIKGLQREPGFFAKDEWQGYPEPDYNSFFEHLTKGSIFLQGKAVGLITEKGNVLGVMVEKPTGEREMIEADIFFSTVSPDEILEYKFGPLPFRGVCLVAALVEAPKLPNESPYWIYFSSRKLPYTRITMFGRIHRFHAQREVVTFELPISNGNQWDNQEYLLKSINETIQRYFFTEISNSIIIRKEKTYPLALETSRKQVTSYLLDLSFLENFYVMGRLGFWPCSLPWERSRG